MPKPKKDNKATRAPDDIRELKMNATERRPRWSGPPTEQERKIIYSYACYGATDEDIRTIMGMSNESLYRYFSEELQEGRSNARSKIAQRLYQIAVGFEEVKDDEGNVVKEAKKPNLSALIFLAKTRLGWKETQVIESNEIKTSVQIFIPHNGRMPIKQNPKEIENDNTNN